jgi:hypothetical protein
MRNRHAAHLPLVLFLAVSAVASLFVTGVVIVLDSRSDRVSLPQLTPEVMLHEFPFPRPTCSARTSPNPIHFPERS